MGVPWGAILAPRRSRNMYTCRVLNRLQVNVKGTKWSNGSRGSLKSSFSFMCVIFWLLLIREVLLNRHCMARPCTLFSERSAHENQPNFLRSLGHRPRPRVILILSIGLESNLQNRMEFLNGVFCILLSRPFDKIDMTLGQVQWPRVTGRTWVNQCALLLEKSIKDLNLKTQILIFPCQTCKVYATLVTL